MLESIAASSASKADIEPNLPLRCYVYRGSSGQYYAECIDLNLSARAKTQKKAVSSLKSAIYGYLQVAFDGDPQGLVPRPAPLPKKARYHLFRVLAGLHKTMAEFSAFVVKADSGDVCYT